MYKLKQIPEDFVVKEINTLKLKDSGKYLCLKLRKKNKNTLDVIGELARILKLKEKQIGFAGSKDKNAVTEQMISVSNVRKDIISKIKISGVELEPMGYSDEPITLGALEGNSFEIVIRNLEPKTKINKISPIPNYFDEQRFSENNVAIGRHLIKKEFGPAVKLMDSPECRGYLENKKNDFVGALKKVPLRLLKMYVHAFQSFLWNETLSSYLKAKFAKRSEVVREIRYSLGTFVFIEGKNIKSAGDTFLFDTILSDTIPLLGFLENPLLASDLKEITSHLMKREGLSSPDFIIRQIPELSLEGGMRDALVEVKNLNLGKLEKDELNPEKYQVKVSFTLPKGSYATMVIKGMLEKVL